MIEVSEEMKEEERRRESGYTVLIWTHANTYGRVLYNYSTGDEERKRRWRKLPEKAVSSCQIYCCLYLVVQLLSATAEEIIIKPVCCTT